MSIQKIKVGDQTFDLRLDFFLCPNHGIFDPSRFDSEWTTDEGCPVRMADEESCGETLTAIYLDSLSTFTQPDQPSTSGSEGQVLPGLLDEAQKELARFGQIGDYEGPIHVLEQICEYFETQGGYAHADAPRLRGSERSHVAEGERCENCGEAIDLVWWCYDDFLWEAVTGKRRQPGSGEPAGGLWCIRCFDRAAKDLCPWIEWAPTNARHLLSPEVSERIAYNRHLADQPSENTEEAGGG